MHLPPPGGLPAPPPPPLATKNKAYNEFTPNDTTVVRYRFDPLRALEYLKSLPIYEDQAVYSETLPGRAGEYEDTLRPLHPEVKAALERSKGVTRYVTCSTPTASALGQRRRRGVRCEMVKANPLDDSVGPLTECSGVC